MKYFNRCFFGYHTWEYTGPSDAELKFHIQKEIWIPVNNVHIELQTTKFYNRCFRKEIRNIIDMGRGIIWRKTKRYTISELRTIRLKEIIGD
jgi:hypothetical protein